jgi:acyl-CoA thioesterase-1
MLDDHSRSNFCAGVLALFPAFGLAFVLFLALGALRAPHAQEGNAVRIVAIGASNTSGWLISSRLAYPAVLQDMLRARGIKAEVINAGQPFDTTSGMLARIDVDVPPDAEIVILQPGGNDRRFFGTKERRSANIEAMKQHLHARAIRVIVYDEEIPWRYVFDGIHLTAAGHRMVASALLPQVEALIERKARQQ